MKRSIMDLIPDTFRDSRALILSMIRRCGKTALQMPMMQTRTRYCPVDFKDLKQHISSIRHHKKFRQS